MARSPSQGKQFAWTQSTEAANQEDGAVANVLDASQQLRVHLDGKDIFVALFDFRNYGFASDIFLQHVLIDRLGQASLDQIAYMIDHPVGIAIFGHFVQQHLHAELGDVVQSDMTEDGVDITIQIVVVRAYGGVAPVRAAHGNIDSTHPFAEGDGAVGGTRTVTRADDRQFLAENLFGIRLAHRWFTAHDAGAMVALGSLRYRVGQIDVIGNLPAAGGGERDLSLLIASASASHGASAADRIIASFGIRANARNFRGHHDPPEELAAKAVAVFHHQSGFCFRGLANPGENLEHN